MPLASVSTMAHRMRRTILAGAATALALALTTACTPDPAPSPTPTGFASEEDAFAAAEATYRAYVDALNDVDFAQPTSFEPALAWTTGDANAADRKDFSASHAEGVTFEGSFKVASFTGVSYDEQNTTIRASTCLDVSGTDVLDSTGKSTVAPDRPPVIALTLAFTGSETPTALALSSATATDGGACSP